MGRRPRIIAVEHSAVRPGKLRAKPAKRITLPGGRSKAWRGSMTRVWQCGLFLGLFILSGLLGGCRPPRTEPTADAEVVESPWFLDWTDEKGLHFQHDAGPAPGHYFMPQMIGSGAALFDFN